MRLLRHAHLFVIAALFAGCHSTALGTDGPESTPLVHRATAPACTSERPPGLNISPDMGSSFLPVSCTSDADCTSGANGRCVGDPHDGYRCSYDECVTDADCPTGTLCDCRSVGYKGTPAGYGPTRCLPTNCRTDADCGANGYCSPTFDNFCGAYTGTAAWKCHTRDDSCTNDSDCAAIDAGFSFGAAPYCSYSDEAGAWSCSNAQCAG